MMRDRGIERAGRKRLLATVLLVVGSGLALAADHSPYANVERPVRVLWGDTHLHTANSLDARLLGVTLGVADALIPRIYGLGCSAMSMRPAPPLM